MCNGFDLSIGDDETGAGTNFQLDWLNFPFAYSDLSGVYVWFPVVENEELQIMEGSAVVVKRVPAGRSPACDL